MLNNGKLKKRLISNHSQMCKSVRKIKKMGMLWWFLSVAIASTPLFHTSLLMHTISTTTMPNLSDVTRFGRVPALVLKDSTPPPKKKKFNQFFSLFLM